MKEAIDTIKSMYSEFFEGGAYIALFLISLLYIFLIKKEENKKVKIFLWLSLVLWIVILNPIVYKVLEPVFTGNVYWRMFWMLPIGVTIPFVATDLIYKCNKKLEQVVVFISIAIIIIVSGKCVFNSDNFELATNYYKLPQESLEVAKIISEDGDGFKVALVPEEMVAHIRQYDSNIIMRYPRNAHTYEGEAIVLSLASGDVEAIVKDAETYTSNYVVFRKETELQGSMEDYGYKVLGETSNYIVYNR